MRLEGQVVGVRTPAGTLILQLAEKNEPSLGDTIDTYVTGVPNGVRAR